MLKKFSFHDFVTGCLRYVANFFHETTFHGLRQIVIPRRHWFEVILWIAIVTSSCIGAIWIMYRNYTRFQDTPVVTSVYKNYMSWNISLPATTLCYTDKFDEDRGKAIVKSKWGLEETDEKFRYYMKFLKTLTNNSTYTQLNAFAEFKDDELLNKENLTLLMDEAAYDIEILKITRHVEDDSYFHRTMLEMGICYSYNSLITQDLAPRIIETPETNKTFEPVYCFYFYTICYGVVEHFLRSITFYVHSSYEIPEINSKGFFLEVRNDLETRYKHLDILSSTRIRPLRPEQRHCYFYDESPFDNIKYYSFNLCRIQCRRNLAMKLCKCVPHFYKTQAGQPQCTLKQLECIDQHSHELIQLVQTKGNKTNKVCDDCYNACEEVNYYLETEVLKPWSAGMISITKYSWGIDKYSKTRINREILFGVEDLLTSLGGTAGFFLGISIMSGIELIYFFTLRLIRYIFMKSTSKNIKEQKIKHRFVDNFPPPPPRHISHYWKTARQYSFQIARQRRVQGVAQYY